MRHVAIVLLLLLSTPAMAEETPSNIGQKQTTNDVPLGAPYRTGDVDNNGIAQSQVPLRDYLSARIDQALERLENLERQMLRLLDERDRQYSQRFEAQQKALGDALQASKESGAKELQATKEQSANALAASEKAIIKAEDAANKRFESVNEFRSTLSDQAEKFVTKDTFIARFDGMDTRFKTLEEKVGDVITRLNGMSSEGKGAGELWGWIIGAMGILGILYTVFRNSTQSTRTTRSRS